MDLQSKSNITKGEKLNLQSQNQLVQGFPKEEGGGHSLPDATTKDPSLLIGAEMESKLYVFSYCSFLSLYYEAREPLCVNHFYRDTTKDPTYWSKVCLHNMAKLAKEATTVRRVLEPLFHNFDSENHWSSQKGIASSVLMYLQSLLAESGSLGTFSAIISLIHNVFSNFLCNQLSCF